MKGSSMKVKNIAFSLFLTPLLLSAEVSYSNSQDSAFSGQENNTSLEPSSDEMPKYKDSKALNVETKELSKQVVSATGFEQDLRDAPASMSIITNKELQERPIRDLGEAVSQVPGVSIDHTVTSFGGYSISIRGMPADYTLLLVDSKRQDGSSETFPNINYSQASFMPPLAAIDRIEVIRGPASVIYGSDAIGGVVNVILKKSFDKWSNNIMLNSTLQEVPYFGHSVGASVYSAGPIDKAKKWSLQIRAKDTHQFAQQSMSIPLPNGISLAVAGTPPIVGFGLNNQYQVGARVGYMPSEKNYFYVDYSYFGQWFDPKYFKYSVFNRNNSIIRHQGSYGLWKTDTSIQYNIQHNASRKRIAQDIVLEHRSSIPFWRMKLNVGGQYIYSSVSALYGTVFGGDVGNYLDRHTFALYAEDQWAIVDKLLLTLGVRANMSDDYAFNASPRAYLVYNALEHSVIGDLTFKGGVSTGFKMPSMTNVAPGWGFSTGQGWIRVYGNPDLKPESSINYELTAIHETDFTQVSLTGFFTQFRDKITSTRANVGDRLPAGFTCTSDRPGVSNSVGTGSASCQYSYNVDTAQSYGLEVYTQIKPFGVGVGDLGANVSYTWNKNESTSGATKGLPLAGVPEHTLNASINYSWKDLGVYLRGEYRARQLRTNVLGRTSTQAALETWRRSNPGKSEYYNPYFLLHLGANYNITRALRLQFGIYNLLNHNFIDYYESKSMANSKITTTLYNNYNVIREGRRYYIALNMDF
ncbi:TonB-dependent receptor domain-containing protein [Helicobacter fennelliae]|nr:TonB-dependent receptor [Helicobacter fennelliae]